MGIEYWLDNAKRFLESGDYFNAVYFALSAARAKVEEFIESQGGSVSKVAVLSGDGLSRNESISRNLFGEFREALNYRENYLYDRFVKIHDAGEELPSKRTISEEDVKEFISRVEAFIQELDAIARASQKEGTE